MSLLGRLFSGNNHQSKNIDFKPGDIIYKHRDGQYDIWKLLVIGPALECYHILSYTSVDNLPAIEDINKLDILIYHAPFDKKVFADATLLTNKPIIANDLIGYHEYLRQTQSPDQYVPIANEYYQSGLSLTNAGKHNEAIDAYSKAIDLFPAFFEAIDNRAFCKMDLGLWEEAIEDFELSLIQHPNSVLAEFSIGECYFNLDDYQKAKQQFEKAHKIDPNDQAPQLFLDKVNSILENGKPTKF